ncbi:MAG: TraB/GumN family protein [Pseudomonadota bacterium]
MTRQVSRWLCALAAGLLAGPLPPAAAAADSEPAYDDLPGAKALAVSTERPGEIRAVSHSRPNALAASLAAREQCQTDAAPDALCEVVRLDDERITTGREILSRLPEQRHPLFLWRYRHAGATLYLAGSVHVLKPTIRPLPRQVLTAFSRSDYLVLEVNVEAVSPRTLERRTLEYARLPEGQTLGDVLPAALYDRLARELPRYGSSLAAVDKAKPALVMNQLVIGRLMALGYLPDAGLENRLLRRRTDQRILELETLESQLALLFEQPMKTQIELLAETLDMADRVEPALADMITAWLSGDDARLLTRFRDQAGNSPLARAFNEQLLDQRNRRMADRISEYLHDPAEPDAVYFVLVGAAHLVGEDGIVEELARRGLPGERLYSDARLPP